MKYYTQIGYLCISYNKFLVQYVTPHHFSFLIGRRKTSDQNVNESCKCKFSFNILFKGIIC